MAEPRYGHSGPWPLLPPREVLKLAHISVMYSRMAAESMQATPQHIDAAVPFSTSVGFLCKTNGQSLITRSNLLPINGTVPTRPFLHACNTTAAFLLSSLFFSRISHAGA